MSTARRENPGSWYHRFSKRLAQLTSGVCIALTLAMTATVLIAVFYRYVLNSPLSWPSELSRYLLVAVVFLGASIAVRERLHVGLSFLIDRLSPRQRLAATLSGNSLILLFLGVLLFESCKLAFWEGPRQTSPTLGVSMTYAFAPLFIGTALMIVQVIQVMLDDVEACGSENPPGREDAKPDQTK